MKLVSMSGVAFACILLTGCGPGSNPFDPYDIACGDGWKPLRDDVIKVAEAGASSALPVAGGLIVGGADYARQKICEAYAKKHPPGTKAIEPRSVTVVVGGRAIRVKQDPVGSR